MDDSDPDVAQSAEDAIDTIAQQVTPSADNEHTLPERAQLRKNFPNPFNPVTHIPFSLPGEAYISLAVYDLSGRKVATLADKRYSPGEHQLAWQPEDVGSGVFVIRLEVDGKIAQTQKAVYIK